MINPNITLEQLNALNKNTMMEHLDIEFTAIGEEFVSAKMPVDHRTHQPFGLLHGGASVTLAETLGSVASTCVIDNKTKFCVGLEINANHLKAIKEGYVYGTTRPIHLGKSTHVWEIRIEDDKSQLICISRITMAILDKK